MSTYSSFFASGLLAPAQVMDIDMSRAYTPEPPSSPMMISSTPGDPIDRNLTPTPTPALSQLHPSSAVSQSSTLNAFRQSERPRLRKRRSSLSVTATPMGGIKSPTRNAGNALQRTAFMSPSRSRSSSINEYGFGIASEETSLTGRMRSGSMGGPLRPRRMVRKASAPAPTAPLPALPIAHLPPVPKIQLQVPQGKVTAPQPRRPLSNRFHSSDNRYALHAHSNITRNHSHDSMTSLSLALSSPDFAGGKFAAAGSPPLSPMEYRIDEEMKEN